MFSQGVQFVPWSRKWRPGEKGAAETTLQLKGKRLSAVNEKQQLVARARVNRVRETNGISPWNSLGCLSRLVQILDREGQANRRPGLIDCLFPRAFPIFPLVRSNSDLARQTVAAIFPLFARWRLYIGALREKHKCEERTGALFTIRGAP